MDELLDFVLELYRLAQDTTVEEFQVLALELLKAVVPFRSATWSSAEVKPKAVEIFSTRLYNEPEEVLSQFTALNKTHRRAVDRAGDNAGRAISFEATQFYASREERPILNYTKRYGHDKTLLITDTNKEQWIACYRVNNDERYGERDRKILNALMPHFVEALAINRIATIGERLSGRSSQHGARALIDRNGVFLHCGAKFLDFLRQEQPDFNEPKVSASLLAQLHRKASAHIANGSVNISAQSFGDAMLLTARSMSPLQRLSPRELVIAREFGAGKSYKAIANEVRLAPATVRNVLQNTYKKLRINNKAALARLFELE